MRLWHYKLVPYLDDQRLLGQHRECCALRGKGWGKKHSTVDYVFKHNYFVLFNYHLYVMKVMESRNFNVSEEWKEIGYRGKQINLKCLADLPNFEEPIKLGPYPEHNIEYLEECKKLLSEKNPEYYTQKYLKNI